MTNELVDAAQSYLSAGLSIIALTGKTPNTRFHPNGKDSALFGVPENAEDDALIQKMFTHPTTSGVAIVLTHQIVVVDIDGEQGAEELAMILGMNGPGMVEWAAGLDTPVAVTGRGMHIYYVSTRPRRTMKLGEKLDLKAEGGYVAAPPSRHPSGAVYLWGDGRELVSGQRVHLDWLPDAIEERLNDHELMRDTSFRERIRRQPTIARLNAAGHIVFGSEPAKSSLDGVIEALRNDPVGSGNGNNLLFWAGVVAAEDGYTLPEAFEAFVPVVTSEWASPMELRVARTTIRSGFRKGSKDG